jgi:hypothetical protein
VVEAGRRRSPGTTLLGVGSAHEVGQQQGVRERADAARDGRDGRSHRSDALELDIPHDRPVDHVDSDIHDDHPAPDHAARDEARMSGRHDEDLGGLDVLRQVSRARVAHGHGRVLADEEEGRRHADHGRAADDHRTPALDLHRGTPQDHHGYKTRRRTESDETETQEPGELR